MFFFNVLEILKGLMMNWRQKWKWERKTIKFYMIYYLFIISESLKSVWCFIRWVFYGAFRRESTSTRHSKLFSTNVFKSSPINEANKDSKMRYWCAFPSLLREKSIILVQKYSLCIVSIIISAPIVLRGSTFYIKTFWCTFQKF